MESKKKHPLTSLHLALTTPSPYERNSTSSTSSSSLSGSRALSKLMSKSSCSPNIFLKVKSALGSRYFFMRCTSCFDEFICKLTTFSSQNQRIRACFLWLIRYLDWLGRLCCFQYGLLNRENNLNNFYNKLQRFAGTSPLRDPCRPRVACSETTSNNASPWTSPANCPGEAVPFHGTFLAMA